MSILFSHELLACDTCPFLSCYERGTCYQCKCYIDGDIDIQDHCDCKTCPSECPIKNGMIITIEEQDGKLAIGRSYK